MYTIGGLIDLEFIKKIVTKEQLKELSPTWAKTRNYNRMGKALYQRLMGMFFDKVVEKLLDSDRLLWKSILNYEQTEELYITDVLNIHRKFANYHTGGKVYATTMTNFPNINIKFNGKSKQELSEKLKNGQSFY